MKGTGKFFENFHYILSYKGILCLKQIRENSSIMSKKLDGRRVLFEENVIFCLKKNMVS